MQGYLTSREFFLSDSERRGISLLVVDQAVSDRSILASTLQSYGIPVVSAAESCVIAIERVNQRKFTHVIFSANDSSMPASAFLTRLLALEPDVIAIPASHSPRTDHVFELLQRGARGYLVKPFTSDSLEEALALATKGEPFPEVVLNAKDRNEAFAAMIATSLDRLTIAMRQAAQFETARFEIPYLRARFRRAVEIASLFSQGGPPRFTADLIEFMTRISSGPASALGRIRKRLREKKSVRSSPQA